MRAERRDVERALALATTVLGMRRKRGHMYDGAKCAVARA